ncbi:MAG: hypothetical protein GF388_03540 [Candidatus Aegiribacteria sp.]|nr:hypothetical protein [Candidatus Aegiribacteria sp.]MBD3294336.1 hypothetical protein [Candidatus Fermentibacteria bacterium]
MLLTIFVLILTGYNPPVEVYDYPFSDETVYLTYREGGDAYEVSLSMSPDSGASAITNFAEFPGMLNPTKTYAGFVEGTDSLEVFSQYPFSANYFKAVYSYTEEEGLILLEAGDHDYYKDALQRMIENAEEGSFEDVLQAGWDILYPGANPYAREMCVLLLSEGIAQVEEALQAGQPLETALEPMEEADELAYNLIGDSLHNVILSAENYPNNLETTIDQYRSLLEEYAELLEENGEEVRAREVLEVISALSEG